MVDGVLPPLDEANFVPAIVLPEDQEPEVPQAYRQLAEVTSEFDPRFREDFIGLLYVGKLEAECTVAGHRFLLRTPSQSLKLQIGPLHKPFVNTMSVTQAYAAMTVACYLQSIDGEPYPEPLRGEDSLRERYNWVISSIYSEEIITRVYDQCLLLEQRVFNILQELDGLGESSS